MRQSVNNGHTTAYTKAPHKSRSQTKKSWQDTNTLMGKLFADDLRVDELSILVKPRTNALCIYNLQWVTHEKYIITIHS